MKKILVSVLALLLAFSVCLTTACGGANSEEAKAVIDLINKIPDDITGYSAGYIELAEKAYADLSDEDKAQVSNYATLQSARSEYDSKYVSILSMSDLSLITDYSYWFNDGSEPTFSLVEDPEGKYGMLLKITQLGSGAIVLKYRTDAIFLEHCTEVVFTALNGSGTQAGLDTKASGKFTGSENVFGASGLWLTVRKDASTYAAIKDDNKTPKKGEGQFGIWSTVSNGTYFIAGIYAVKA